MSVRVSPRLASGLALSLVVLLGGGGLVWAYDNLLHEYFVIPEGERPTDGPTSQGPGDPGAAALGEALGEALAESTPGDAAAGGLQPPALTLTNQGDELEYSASGAPRSPDGEPVSERNGPSDPERAASLDRQTTLDQSLSYYAVFNPSVSPWKRVTARNQVNADYTITARSPRRRLEVRDTPLRAGYERFWGSMLVRMEAGRPLALPSVAATMSVLRYQTEPPIELAFQHEHLTDNYYVTGGFSGTVRINFLVEAPSSYFGGAVDPRAQIADTPAHLRPQVPAEIRAAADRVIDAIGVNRRGTLKEQLEPLVAWFRSFEAREFPASATTRDVYLDIALNKLGVCRHRALAFVITAQSLGMAARYVHNEAHAFVEVFIPPRGWLRIDLGGAAVDFEMRNSADKSLHTPPEPDSLPQPEDFTSSYSHRVGAGQQEADVNADGVPESLEGIPSQTTSPRLRGADGPQDTPADQASAAEETPGEHGEAGVGEEEDGGAAPPFPEAPADAAPDAPPRRATQLRLLPPERGREPSVFRGEAIQLRGRLSTDQGLPLASRRVEAYLAPSGGGKVSPDALQRIGEGTTDEAGLVTLEARIPPTTHLGRWSIYLFYPGDERFERAHSD